MNTESNRIETEDAVISAKNLSLEWKCKLFVIRRKDGGLFISKTGVEEAGEELVFVSKKP